MTRRQLLESMDSYELTMWGAFFKEVNKPVVKKQDPDVLAGQLKNVFASHAGKKAKKK